MKTCSNCGYQNEDSELFCKKCGSSLDGNQTASTQSGNPFPLLQLLKSHGASGLFLVSILVFTLNLILTFVSNVLGSSLRDVAPEMANSFEDLTGGSMAGIVAASSVGVLIAMIPTLLCCIGLWKIYMDCKKEGGEPLSTSGFSLIKGATIFNFVIYCIGVGFVGVFLIFCVALSRTDALSDLVAEISEITGTTTLDVSQAGNLLMIYFAVILLFAVVFGILYYVKVIGSINRAKEIIVTGTAKKNVSLFVAVINLIGGVCSVIGGLFPFRPLSIVSGISTLLLGIVILSFRGAAKDYIS